MTSPITDPRETAFFATDPSRQITEQPPPVQVPDYRASSRRVTELGVALASAFVAYRMFLKRDLQSQPPPPMNQDRYRHVKALIRRTPFWVQLSVPIIKEAIELGVVGQLSSEEIEVIARSYAEDMGKYINDTSSDALVEGFEEQLQKRWSDTVAWHRAAEAVGLDKQQMRTYMRNVLDQADTEAFDLIPPRAQAFLDKAILDRADRFGSHEIWQAKETGKAIAWLSQQRNGTIPMDAQKMWMTAEDEMVCVQCGPLHKKRVNLDEQWETQDGNRYWAPSAHPNCRCDIRLIYPEIRNDILSAVDDFQYVRKDMPGDPVDRDKRGRFARVEGRKPKPVKEVVRDQVLDDFLAQIREGSQEIAEEIQQVENPFKATRQVANPFSNSSQQVANPFAQEQIANPFSAAEVKNPFASEVVENPFAPAKATRRRKHTRQNLILINGKYEVAERPNAGVDNIYDAEVARTYVWAMEHYGNMGVDPGTADAIPHYRDKVIDFDYGNPYDRATKPATRGYMYQETPSSLMLDTEELYDDRRSWDTPTGASFTREYNDTWHKWYGGLVANRERYAYGLTPSESQRILQNAGNEALLDHEGRVHRIVNADQSSPVFHSFVNFMENSKINEMTDQASLDLQTISHEMQSAGYFMHTPTVFILNDLDPESGIIDPDRGEVALAGKYRVVDNHYISTIMEMGDVRPPDIKGINFVYLETVDDPEKESVLNMEEDYDFDPYNMTGHNKPQSFPGIGYFDDEYPAN